MSQFLWSMFEQISHGTSNRPGKCHVISNVFKSTCQLPNCSNLVFAKSEDMTTMASLRNSLSSFSLKELISPSKHRPIQFLFCSQIMTSTSRNADPDQFSLHKMVHQVPGLVSNETNRFVDETFGKYSSKNAKRNGKGIAIVWFRNDLRVLDNEALYKAWVSSEMVLPVYCVDPRLFKTTYNFGFPKTGGIGIRLYIQ